MAWKAADQPTATDMVTSVFDELDAEELTAARTRVADAGLDAARRLATTRLVDGPAAGLAKPATVMELLLARDQADPRWERLEPFETRWALLVVRLLAPVMNPAAAVADARRRGATWAAIGEALGVTAQSAHARFGPRP
ncbi:hypothetical protein PFJ02_23675 [Mycobacterium xenopi]|uniref:hypothetical protein n=1 Tax=Mycobacterium xenopi TaxID=1789 RepID=UPI0022EAD41F|nr:hypothetical protein [Mycobacterium xenopi]MDA3664968.1 hypothetical protein [Mycobacterium xenopi]